MDQSKPTIPWWRGPSLSFTTVSDQADNSSVQRSSFGTGRKSITRSSVRRSALGRSSNVPSTDPTAVYTAGGGETNDCVLCADGSVALLAHTDGRVGVVHPADGARGDFTQHAPGKAVRQVAISADGLVGASAALDGTVRVFQTDTLIQVALLRQTGYPWANGVALSSDGSVLIASFTPRDSDRGKIVRFDWAQRTVTVLWLGFHRVFEVAANHDASKILFIRQGGVVSLLEAAPGTTPSVGPNWDYMKGDLDVAMDAAAERVLIIDKQLQLHSKRNSGELVDNFVDYKPASIRKIDITADGARAIEICKRCVLVRNLGTGTVVLALTHKYRLAQCAIAADGGTIIASDVYGTLVMWRPDYLPKTDLVARSLDGQTLDLRGIRSVLDRRTGTTIAPILPVITAPMPKPQPQLKPSPQPEQQPPSRNNTPPLSDVRRNDTPPTPATSSTRGDEPHTLPSPQKYPVRHHTPPTPPAVRQCTPPTSPVQTASPPQLPDSPPVSNPKLPLPPAIHPKFLSEDSSKSLINPTSPLSPVEPLRLELVSVKGVSVEPSTPSPALTASLSQKTDVSLPTPSPVVVTKVETTGQLDVVDEDRAFTTVESVASVRDEEEVFDEYSGVGITPVESTGQIIPVVSTPVLHELDDGHVGIIPVESTPVLLHGLDGEDGEHVGHIVTVKSTTVLEDLDEENIPEIDAVIGEYEQGVEETYPSNMNKPLPTIMEEDEGDNTVVIEPVKQLRQEQDNHTDNSANNEFLRCIGSFQNKDTQVGHVRTSLTDSKVLRGNMFLEQQMSLHLSQPEEYDLNLGGGVNTKLYDTAPRIEEYEQKDGFPAAPSFPVLEPEMSGTANIFRSMLK